MESLFTLSCFADIDFASSDVATEHERVLCGTMDILVTQGGVQGVHALFERMEPDRLHADGAAWWLTTGEGLVRYADRRVMNKLRPLADK